MKGVITTLSLNPSIDRTVSVAEFRYGSMNRVLSARDDVGGKAINLSVVLKTLGANARCIGLLPAGQGEQVEDYLRVRGVETEFVPVPGRVRVNLKLLDEGKQTVTELNERGEPMDEVLQARVLQQVERCSKSSDYLVLTGSLPPGCPAAYYEALIRRAREICRVALDAEGEPFRLGLSAKPHFIKPNRHELELMLGRTLGSIDEVAREARALNEQGIETVCVSLGDEGALICRDGEALLQPALKLPVRSTVGAGDSMVAGTLWGLSRGLALEEAFRMGAAAASASVVSEGTQLVDFAVYQEMLQRIKIQRL